MKRFAFLSVMTLAVVLLVSCTHERRERVPRGGGRNGGELVEPQTPGEAPATPKKDAPIVFKFYLERSGSMVAYDNNKTSGDFKDAIVNLLNSVPESNDEVNMLYVVNSGVFPYNKSFRSFAKSHDIFGETKNLGDPRYTDFSCIFDSLIHRTHANEISILASDLIYSTDNMRNISVERILGEAKNLTMMSFKGNSDKDVLIIKLLSDFDGKYYPYNSVSKGFDYHGNRPYYLLMVADHNVMDRIVHDKKYAEFRNFEKLRGYQDYYLFAGDNSTQTDFSLLPGNRLGKNTNYKIGRGQVNAIHRISDIEPNKNGEAYLVVALDLSMIFMSEDMKCNPNSYDIESKSEFTIDEVVPVTERMKTKDFMHYAGSSTHLMILRTDKENLKRIDQVHVRMPNRLPEWISNSTTSDDTHLKDPDFAETTFAFKELCQGIYNAYYPSTMDPAYLDFTIEIRK